MDNHANNPAGGVRSPSAPAPEKRFIKVGHTCLGVSEGRSLILTGTDQNGSLLWSRNINSCKGTVHSWSPYGSAQPADASLPGFNGERIDPVSGTYHLGNGYRTYNPALMRFNCPDSLSPFGAGGINPYAYCAGDPVNHTDPSGHLSWQAILGITLGAIGLAVAVFTGGMSIAAAGGVAAALGSASATALVAGGLGVAADVTAIASGAVEDSDPEASSILGWVSLAFGIPGMLTGIAGLGKSIGKRIRPNINARTAKFPRSRALADNAPVASSSGGIDTLWKPIPVRNRRASAFTKEFYADIDYDAFGEVIQHYPLGYVSDIRGTGEAGLVLHGDPDGALTGIREIKGQFARANFYDMNDFVRYVREKQGINLAAYNGKRLHLIACYAGGKTGTAQRLANHLKRPVVAYGKKPVGISGCEINELLHNQDTYTLLSIRRRSLNGEEAVTYHPRRLSF